MPKELERVSSVDLSHYAPSYRYNNLSRVESLFAYSHGPYCVLAFNDGERKIHKLHVAQSESESNLHCSLLNISKAEARLPHGLEKGNIALLTTSMPTCTQIWSVSLDAPFEPTSSVQLLTALAHAEDESPGRCNAMTLLPDNKTVAIVIGADNGYVSFATLDIATSVAQYVKLVKVHEGRSVTAVATANTSYLTKISKETSSTSSTSSPPQCAFATGDNGGWICLWNTDYHPYISIPAVNGTECVTAIQIIRSTFVVAAYGSGKLRFFSQATGEVRLEVNAHSRWIDAMVYDGENEGENRLVTAGQDGYVNVWGVPTDENPQFTGVIASAHLPNTLITGVACGCPRTTRTMLETPIITIVAYDQDSMLFYATRPTQ